MGSLIVVLLFVAVVVLLVVIFQQFKGNRKARRTGVPLPLSQAGVLIAVNIALLALCVYLLVRVLMTF